MDLEGHLVLVLVVLVVVEDPMKSLWKRVLSLWDKVLLPQAGPGCDGHKH